MDTHDIFIQLLHNLEPKENSRINVLREGLQNTPTRMVKAWKHWTSGYTMNLEDIATAFKDGGEDYNEMVLVRDIPVYSHCEHHLAPFFGVAHVAYIPKGKILGLSKVARIVDMYARRLQVQERMTNEIADAMETVTDPEGVGVVVECRHMCMESRGIQRIGTTTITSAMRGSFYDDTRTRAEFLSLAKGAVT